ncbi:MAG: hypothetical protein FJX76_24815, partial [Armatimonadetes bacterium]|nr:hypothetical protein [Armatimonadota bacterium]
MRIQSTPPSSSERTALKKWTVLVYANGDGEVLQRLAPSVVRELEAAGSDPRLDLVVQVSRQQKWFDAVTGDWSGARRYHVQPHPDAPPVQREMLRWFIPPYTADIVSPVDEDLGDVDMGDPKTLQQFLVDGIRKHPAERYAVVVYGQGGGFTGSVLDETTGSVIDNAELAGALAAASAQAGQKIDLLAFDGNLMGQLEVADQVRDAAEVMVASEGPVSLGSLPLDLIAKDLKYELADGKDVSAEDLARWFVFEARYQPRPAAEMMAPTLSALRLDRVGDVKAAWGDLAAALRSRVTADADLGEALREDIRASRAFVEKGKGTEPYEDFRDVAHFAETVLGDARLSADAAVTAAARRVIGTLQSAVIDEFHVKKLENAHGLSAYLPTDLGHDMPATFFVPDGWDPTHAYGETGVARDTVWMELLNDISRDTALRERLAALGVPATVIHKMAKVGAAGLAAARAALTLASKAGHYEAYQALRGKQAQDFLGMPAEVATRVGMAGGAYEAFQGAARLMEAASREDIANRTTMAVDGAAEVVTGGAVMATMIGMSVAAASGITAPAAAVAFAVPIARAVFDLWASRH